MNEITDNVLALGALAISPPNFQTPLKLRN